MSGQIFNSINSRTVWVRKLTCTIVEFIPNLYKFNRKEVTPIPYKDYPKSFSGFCIVYRSVNNDLRSTLLDCTTLREALEIATARGIALKDIGAALPIGKMATLYREDAKRITYGTEGRKRKKKNGKPLQDE